jgi:hypothetical protein
VHDTFVVPDPVTLAGVIFPQVRPEGIVSVRLVVPAKPFTAVIVIVEFIDDPTFVAAGVDAAILKSWKLKVAVALCFREPLVPVTVRM